MARAALASRLDDAGAVWPVDRLGEGEAVAAVSTLTVNATIVASANAKVASAALAWDPVGTEWGGDRWRACHHRRSRCSCRRRRGGVGDNGGNRLWMWGGGAGSRSQVMSAAATPPSLTRAA